jgi:steroid delta-isomerase
VSSAQAQSADETAIRDALTAWTQNFRGAPERSFDNICSLLRRSLADTTKRYSYTPNIKEVIVSGDLAVVRLVWTLKVKRAGAAREAVSREPGIDIFRKQPDGSWKIIRYLAYEE